MSERNKVIPQSQATIAVIPVMGSIRRRFKRNMENPSYPFLVTVMVSLSRYSAQTWKPWTFYRKACYFLMRKGMSVSDIEEEMREIYEIELSTSADWIWNEQW